MAQPYAPLPTGFDDESDRRANMTQPIIRQPETYYGEGAFDAPSSESSASSEDEESDALLEKPPSPGATELGIPRSLQRPNGRRRPASLRCLILCLVGLVGLAAVIGVLAAASYSGGQAYRPRGTKKIELDHVHNGTFGLMRKGLNWVPEAGDGVYSTSSGPFIQLVDLKSNTTRNLLTRTDVTDEHGSPLAFDSWRLSPGMTHLLVRVDTHKQWRHSSHANFYVHEISTKQTRPVVPPTDPPETSIAVWAKGDALAYVHQNDLYILPTPASSSPIRVTSTGNTSLFHGVPDWVYEEEVFSGESALWWSPDGRALAFLSSDETKVPEYAFPIYNPGNDASDVNPYLEETVMKYPKPGYANPLVSVHIFDLEGYTSAGATSPENYTAQLTWSGTQDPDDQVIQEVAWVGPSSLLVKEVNRGATNGSVILFDLPSRAMSQSFAHKDTFTGTVVRALGAQGPEADEGWIDASQTVFPLSAKLSPAAASSGPSYLDIVPSPQGFNHLALFSPASSSTPIFLTNGSWEVIGPIKAVSEDQRRVYFIAAKPSSIERHIYSVVLPDAAHIAKSTEEPDVFTSPEDGGPAAGDLGYYDASFSPGGGYALLNYNGPNVPWQRLLSTAPRDQSNSDANKNKTVEVDVLLTDNALLNLTLGTFDLPLLSRFTLPTSDGKHEMTAYELRPPRMDDSGRTKYPVLFRVYGGPGSQETGAKFTVGWDHHLASARGYIVVVVDGRGTGYRGRAFRSGVRLQLGKWEVEDQIHAAKIWAAKEYVDDKRIGVWGWSYGGFMAAKVVEANGGVHSLGMSVAPVTSWELYDSIYTERYMGLPADNSAGYAESAVHNVTAFHTTHYALAHGSADDNVHYSNSARLLDMLTQNHVRGFRFRMFTDSDHSISTRGGYREVFEYLEDFLVEKWGVGPRKRGW